jgi:hypothetical protein
MTGLASGFSGLPANLALRVAGACFASRSKTTPAVSQVLQHGLDHLRPVPPVIT